MTHWTPLYLVSLLLALGLAGPASPSEKGLVLAYASEKLVVMVGSYDGSHWQPPKQTGERHYKAYRLDGWLGQVVAGPARPSQTTGISARLKTPMARPALLVSGRQPERTVVGKADGEDAELQNLLVEHLKSKGVTTARVTQAVRADLRGDGHLETLVVAQDRQSPVGYNVVAVVEGSRLTPLLEEDYWTSYDLLAVLDLDHKPGLEVIVHYQFHEGESVVVYGFSQGKPTVLARADWGLN